MSDKLSELYNVLKQDDTYSSKLSDEAAFKEKFSTPEKLDSLYDVLRQDDTYASKLTTVDDFKAKFAPSTTPIEKKSQVQTTLDVANTTSDSAPGVLAPPATPAPVNNNPLVPQQDQLANNIKQAATVPLNPAVMSNNPLVPSQDPLSKNIKDTQQDAVERQKPVVQNALNKSIEKQLLSGGALTKGGDHTQAFFDGMKDKGYSDEQLDKAKDYFKSKWGDAFHNGMEGLNSTSDKEAATEKKQLAYEEDHPIASRAYDMGSRLVSGVEKGMFAEPLKAMALAAKAMGQEGDVTGFATYKMGEHLNKSIDDTFKGYSNEKYKDEAQAIVASTAGSLIPFALGGALGKTMRLAELAPEGGAIAKQMLEHLPATLQAAGDNAVSMFEEASQKVKDAKDLSEEQYSAKYAPGKTDVKDLAKVALEKDELSKQDPSDVGFEAAKSGAMNAGLAFGLPIAHSLEKMDRITGGRIKGLIANGLKDGITPMMQMALQGTMNNMTAKQIFDKSREVMDGVVGAGGSGLAVGMAMSALSAVLGGHLKAAKTTEDRLLIGKAMAEVNKVIQDHKDGSPLDYIKEPHADAEVNKLEKNVDDLKNIVLSPMADKPAKDMAASHLLKMEAQLQGAIEAKRIAATDKAEADVKQEVHASKEKFLQTLIATASEADKPALEAQMEALKIEAPKPATGDTEVAETKIITDEKDSKDSKDVGNTSENATTSSNKTSVGQDAIGEVSSEKKVAGESLPATPEMAKEMGFVNEHEALNSVNKRLGKDYKTFDEVTQRDLVEAKDSRVTEKKAGDQLRLFADFVEGGKISKLKGVKASSGFDVAWDLSLSAISGALKGGAKLADAVEAGLKHIRESDWYKNYTDKKGFEKQYADHMNGEFKAHVEKLSPVKKEINKTTGITREVKKITIDSFKALKEQIRMEARAAKEGFSAGKKEGANQSKAKADHLEGLKKKLTDFVKEAHKQKLFKGDIDGRSIPSLIRSISGVKTEASLNRAMDRVQKTIDDIEYNNKLDQANKYKLGLKDIAGKKTDNKTAFSSTNKKMAEALLELHPEDVENIYHYNRVVGDFVKSIKGKKWGRQPNTEIQEYIESQKDFANNKAKEALLDKYKELRRLGIIDEKTSLEELTKIDEGMDDKTKEQEGELTDEDKNKISKARAALNAFIASARELLPEKAEGELNNARLEALKNIDLEPLTVAELKKLHNAINDVAKNNDYTGAGTFEHRVAAKEKVNTLLDKFKTFVGSRIRPAERTKDWTWGKFIDNNVLKTSMFTLDGFLGKIANTKDAIILLNQTTFGDALNGHSKTLKEHNTVNKELVDIVKKHNLSFADQTKLMMYMDMDSHQPHYGEAELQEHFDNNKKLLKQTISTLLESTDSDNNKMGELLSGLSKEFESAKKLEDVKLSPAQEEVKKFISEFYESKEAGFRDMAEVEKNIKLDRQANYSPRSYIRVDPTEDQQAIDLNASSDVKNKYIDRRVTGRVKDRVIKDKLEEGKAVDYRLLNGFNKTSYDLINSINNTRNYEVVNEVLNNPDFKKFIGGKNYKLFYPKVKAMIDLQKGNMATEEGLSKVVKVSAQIGLITKVAKVTQLVTQYATSMSQAFVNSSHPTTLLHAMMHRFSPTDVSKEFVRKSDILMEDVGQGVITRDAGGFDELSRNVDTHVNKDYFSPIADNTNRIAKNVRDFFAAPMKKSDSAVSRDIWMGEYMDSLISQGKIKNAGDIDLDKEIANPNKHAAALASHAVEVFNNTNSSSTKPTMLLDKSGYQKLINSAFWTLKKFSLNSMTQASNNLRTIMENDGGQGKAYRQVAGYAVQAAVFAAVSAFWWKPGYKALANLINKWEGNKIQESDSMGDKAAEAAFNWAQDMAIGGLAAPTSDGIKGASNLVYKIIRSQDDKLSEFEKNKDLFYVPKDRNWADYAGGLGFLPAKIIDVSDIMLDMMQHPNQASKARMTHSALLNTIGALGLMGGDLNNINSNVSRPLEKEAKAAANHKDPRRLHR